MKTITNITLLIFLLVVPQFHLYSQITTDELMDQLDTQIMEYEALAERISSLDDHLLYSNNELDSKPAEIALLHKDFSEVLAYSEKLYGQIQNELDSFDAGCRMLLEENCPEQEKKFEAFLVDIEPVVEQARTTMETLESVDNRYDEQFLIKTFKKAAKESDRTRVGLENLKDNLKRLAEGCGSDN